jgi:protein-S-isoprenylcysteine O-methyltransferase Ste14
MTAGGMTEWGCGPKLVKGTLLVALIVYAVQHFFFSEYRIPLSSETALMTGIFWFILGIPVWFSGAMEIKKHFPDGKLVTSGIFRYIQHPIYSAFCLFYIPGIVIMTRSVFAIVLPFVFYLLIRRHIPYEERYLEDKFGKEYTDYRERTGRIFPRLG